MSLIKPIATVASAIWLLTANAALESPRSGYVRLANGEVRVLRGMAGAFYFGERTAAMVDHHAFNGTFGIRTSDGHAEFLGASGEVLRIVRLDGEVRSAGLSTIADSAYVLTSAELWRIDAQRADRFAVPDLPSELRVAGISGAGGYIDFATVDDGQVTLRRYWLETGELLIRQSFGGSARDVVFLGDGMTLWTEGSLLNLRRTDGSTVGVDCGEPVVSVSPMSKRMVHVSTEGGHQYALGITGNPADAQSIEARLQPLPESAE